MPYITREDGERFVIPSYRDVLVVKQKSALKKEIGVLSQSYGEYITLQQKGSNQYEVSFSPDAGYLLGETVWHYFKRPLDLIYCERIGDTNEAILVIVKAGSVYLDGSFPIDSIPEELVIFLTQQNNFEIYIYGDVPISSTPAEGKFSFEEGSVKSFNELEEPIFTQLPLLKIYQLQPVEVVLKSFGIGVFPLRQVVLGAAILVGCIALYYYLSRREPAPAVVVLPPNPYIGYYAALSTPEPTQEIKHFLIIFQKLIIIPGWVPTNMDYNKGEIIAKMQSNGGTVENLQRWAKINNMSVDIQVNGIFVNGRIPTTNRPQPKEIYPLNDVLATTVDRLAKVYPGNRMQLAGLKRIEVHSEVQVTINVTTVSPLVLSTIAEQLRSLPFVLQKMSFTVSNGFLSGTITLTALGS